MLHPRLTPEAVGDVVSVGVERLDDVYDGVRRRVLAHLDVVDGLHEHRNLVVDIRQGHTNLGRRLARRRPVVGRRDREVVRVARRAIVVESPEQTRNG